MQALIARGVIGDFRAPDILRFEFTFRYTRWVDAWDAAGHLRGVLDSEQWQRAGFKQRQAVPGLNPDLPQPLRRAAKRSTFEVGPETISRSPGRTRVSGLACWKSSFARLTPTTVTPNFSRTKDSLKVRPCVAAGA